MTCKDCYHYEVCKTFNRYISDENNNIDCWCDEFKDKSKIIELPMKTTVRLHEELTDYCKERCVEEL